MALDPQGALVLQTVAMPADTNYNGDIFGGWIMSQMDLGASIPAYSRARGKVTTVAVEAMVFHKPVAVGDLVSIYARLVKEGTTSMHIDVEVWSTRRPALEKIKVTEATFVYVALDENGKKRALPILDSTESAFLS